MSKRWFMCSMGDEGDDEGEALLLTIMRAAPQHQFQILTKRPELLDDATLLFPWLLPWLLP
jgi:protein gp37